MKTIFLLRHAKSDWHAASGGDHERPLNKRGRAAAERIGRFLAAAGELPAVVASSSATRARQTVEHAARAGAWPCPIEIRDQLYLGSPRAVLEEIRRQPETCSSVLLAGHEPGWSAAVAQLAGGGEVRMVTAAVARLDVAVASWQEVEFGRGQLIWMVTPKLLARAGFE